MAIGFVFQSGKNAGKSLFLKPGEITLGSGKGNKIRIQSTGISKQHCRFKIELKNSYVEDLNSQTGTFVNSHPIQSRTRIQGGDLLQIGNLYLRYMESADGEPPPGVKSHTNVQHTPREQAAIMEAAEVIRNYHRELKQNS